MLKALKKFFTRRVRLETDPKDILFFLSISSPTFTHSPLTFLNTPEDIQDMMAIKRNLEAEDNVHCKVYVGYPVDVREDKGNPAGYTWDIDTVVVE